MPIYKMHDGLTLKWEQQNESKQQIKSFFCQKQTTARNWSKCKNSKYIFTTESNGYISKSQFQCGPANLGGVKPQNTSSIF